MGRWLEEAGQIPDQVLTSPAERAVQTTRLAMEAGGWSRPVAVCDSLYGGVEDLLAELRAQPPSVEVLLVVGHEPTCSQALEALMGGGRVRMPTAALARVELEIASWAELAPGCGELAFLVNPRLFDNGAHDRPQ
jgi:phosphohistidine phosphatase